MKFGVAIGNFGQFGKLGDARDQVRVAVAAEQLGYNSVWVHDHLVIPTRLGTPHPYSGTGLPGFGWRQDIYDSLAMMAAVAVATMRVEIGTSVLIVPYRNPVVLAKMLATIDQLAGGRIRLGIGVGWMPEEFDALGIAEWFPLRGRVTDEWIAICKTLWSESGPASFHGRFASFDDVGAYPKPVKRHIPIWVGGWGAVAARRVARIGDGYHTVNSTPKMFADQLAMVDREMEKRGRHLDEIEVSMLGGIRLDNGTSKSPPALIGGNTQAIIDRLGEYRDVGLQHLVATPRRADGQAPTPDMLIEDMQQLAEDVLPALR
ncbi:MAG: TIGR03619 family F420-dependent LLM class oxidoreductase [Dehalococcoidia bacterium]